MSSMRQLLESMDKFAGEKVGQKPGDQWRGTDSGPPGKKLVGASESRDPYLDELAAEWAQFLQEEEPVDPNNPQAPGTQPSTGTQPAQPGQTPPAGTQPAKPGQPQQAGQAQQPAKPGQPQQSQQGQQQQPTGVPPVASPAQISAMNQLKTAIPATPGSAVTFNPQKAAQAAAQAQVDPKKLTPDQRQQMTALGMSMAPSVTAQNMGKIRSMLPTK